MSEQNKWASWGDGEKEGLPPIQMENDTEAAHLHNNLSPDMGLVLVNEDAIAPSLPMSVDGKPKLWKRLANAFMDKQEAFVTILFVINGVYRWYQYDTQTGDMSTLSDASVTFSLFVWHDKLSFVRSPDSARKVKKGLVRELGFNVSDIKNQADCWFYFPEEFVLEMQQMGFSKLYSLQMAADLKMSEHKLTPNQMIYFSTDLIFSARVLKFEDEVVEQILFNAEDYAIKSLFSTLITGHKIESTEAHVLEVGFAELVKQARLSEFWLLEERIFSLPILPVNLSIIGLMAISSMSVMSLQATHIYMASEHRSNIEDKTIKQQLVNTEIEKLLVEKNPYIPQQLSLNFERFIEHARLVHQPGLSVEGEANYTGREKYAVWWTNGKTPLISFLTIKSPDGCSVITKVSGNGEMAYKEIDCVHPTIFVGRFNPR
jgi:hypothetical protein